MRCRRWPKWRLPSARSERPRSLRAAAPVSPKAPVSLELLEFWPPLVTPARYTRLAAVRHLFISTTFLSGQPESQPGRVPVSTRTIVSSPAWFFKPAHFSTMLPSKKRMPGSRTVLWAPLPKRLSRPSAREPRFSPPSPAGRLANPPVTSPSQFIGMASRPGLVVPGRPPTSCGQQRAPWRRFSIIVSENLTTIVRHPSHSRIWTSATPGSIVCCPGPPHQNDTAASGHYS